jgi:hypothetical protein
MPGRQAVWFRFGVQVFGCACHETAPTVAVDAKNRGEKGFFAVRTAQNTHSGRLLMARLVFVLRPSHAFFQGLYRDGLELHAFFPALEAKPSAYGKLRYAMHLRAHNSCSAQ